MTRTTPSYFPQGRRTLLLPKGGSLFSSEGKPVKMSAFSGGRRGPSADISRLRWSGERDRV